jgi:hypothetical protein
MRAVLSVGAIVALAASGLVAQRLVAAPELRAVSAPAEAIAAGDGVLLAALEGRRPARLVRVRPLTLEPASPPLRLREDFVSDLALSPDGGQLAFGGDQRSRIEFVDLRHWRSLGTMTLPGPRPSGYGGASGLVWTSPRRLVVLSGADYMRAEPIVIDPIARRVVHRSGWRGPPLQSATGGGLLVVLAAPSHGPKPGPARLVAYDARGRLRALRLERIMAGSSDWGPGPARDLTPGLAVDRAGRRAYVVAAEASLVAEVDLRAWRVAYHEPTEPVTAWGRLRDLLEPPVHAKGPPVDAAWREVKVLPNGAIAVTGDNWPPVESRHHPLAVPFGVHLIDPRSWTVRTLDDESEDFALAGGTLLSRRWSIDDDSLEGIGVRAYDSAGDLRFAQFAGADTIVRGAAGRHAYVEVKRDGRRAIHVLDLESGQTVRVLPWREIRVLSP